MRVRTASGGPEGRGEGRFRAGKIGLIKMKEGDWPHKSYPVSGGERIFHLGERGERWLDASLEERESASVISDYCLPHRPNKEEDHLQGRERHHVCRGGRKKASLPQFEGRQYSSGLL